MTQPWHHINDEPHAECGGCGRFYPVRFGSCPFCYVQQFLEIEAEDGCCPVCGCGDSSAYDEADLWDKEE